MHSPNVSVTRRKAPPMIDPRTVRRRLVRMLNHLGLHRAEVSCVLCDDAFIRELNREYRGKDKATDVLSFAMNEGESLPGDSYLLGDIVISVETALRQGKDLDHTPLEEVTSLAAHGLLHLLGYDHIKKNDERIMQSKSRELENLFPRRARP